MEAVDHQNGMLCPGIVQCRQHLGRKALAAAVAGYHLEVVEQVGLQLHAEMVAVYIGAVVEVCLAHSGIDDIAGRDRRRLLWVGDGVPAEAYLVVVGELAADVVGCKRRDDIRFVVHAVDIAQ